MWSSSVGCVDVAPLTCGPAVRHARRATAILLSRCSTPYAQFLELTLGQGFESMRRHRSLIGLAMMAVVAPTATAACSSAKCPNVTYADTVTVTLPKAMVDGHSALRLCVDSQCNELGNLLGKPRLSLSGTVLSAFTPGTALGAQVVVQFVATGASAANATITTPSKVDHHGGCANTRIVRIHYDQASQQLVAD